MADQTPNTVLERLLTEAGWSPGQLASSVNAMFGAGTVSPTAGYKWLGGSVPRRPVANRVAAALSLELCRKVTVSQIWPSLPDDDGGIEPASQGMVGPWERTTAVNAVTDWLSTGDIGRRQFVAVSGAALMRAVWAWLDPHGSVSIGPPPSTTENSSALIEHIETSIPLLQRLDDAHGGAAHLPYVEAQLRAIALVLRDGNHPEPVLRRVLAAASTLGQLCGWMASDAGEHGVAQRHWFTALRAAREIGDRPMAAHILADLAFQAARTGQTRDGVVLGEAAVDVAARSPATVRASVASRLAYAYAAAGRRGEFMTAVERAKDHLAARDDAREPEFMYYLTTSHLDCQAGYALIAMGQRQTRLGDRGGRHDLETGVELLRTGAFELPLTDPSQRRALYEGAWLAVGHAVLADYTEALTLAELAVARLAKVSSPRSVQVLDNLVAYLRPRHNVAEVAERLPAISGHLDRTAR